MSRSDHVSSPRVRKSWLASYEPDAAPWRQLRPVLHGGSLLFFLALFLWHFGHEASSQPITFKFGWFFQYLTFCTLIMQLIQFALALVHDLQPSASLQQWLDLWSCAVFALVLLVSGSYYLMLVLPAEPLYGKDYSEMARWLQLGLHLFNSLAAVMDVLLYIHQRTFSIAAEQLMASLIVTYILWMILCRHMQGLFPYPFMETLPLPWGFICVGIFLVTSCELMFGAGKWAHLEWAQARRQGAEGAAQEPQELPQAPRAPRRHSLDASAMRPRRAWPTR